MNKNAQIGIYYIATGEYKMFFPDFLESVQNFFPKNQKVVKLISDGLEEYKGYEKGKVTVELCPRINNYPWPVVALYKMWHILERYDDSCDYMCYFNANAIIYPHREDIFNLEKLSTSYHSFNDKDNAYNPWPHIHLDPNSAAYMENESYEYIQSGFFFGPKEIIKNMCEDIVNMIRIDSSRHMFAQWHDESYLNKWCVENNLIVDKNYYMTIYQTAIDEERFIYLKNKKIYFKEDNKRL